MHVSDNHEKRHIEVPQREPDETLSPDEMMGTLYSMLAGKDENMRNALRELAGKPPLKKPVAMFQSDEHTSPTDSQKVMDAAKAACADKLQDISDSQTEMLGASAREAIHEAVDVMKNKQRTPMTKKVKPTPTADEMRAILDANPELKKAAIAAAKKSRAKAAAKAKSGRSQSVPATAASESKKKLPRKPQLVLGPKEADLLSRIIDEYGIMDKSDTKQQYDLAQRARVASKKARKKKAEAEAEEAAKNTPAMKKAKATIEEKLTVSSVPEPSAPKPSREEFIASRENDAKAAAASLYDEKPIAESAVDPFENYPTNVPELRQPPKEKTSDNLSSSEHHFYSETHVAPPADSDGTRWGGGDKIGIKILIGVIIVALLGVIGWFGYNAYVSSIEKTLSWESVETYPVPDGLLQDNQTRDDKVMVAYYYDIKAGQEPYAEEFHAVVTYDAIGGSVKKDMTELVNDSTSFEVALESLGNVADPIKATDGKAVRIDVHLPIEAKETVERIENPTAKSATPPASTGVVPVTTTPSAPAVAANTQPAIK